jgi:hypothetical protein
MKSTNSSGILHTRRGGILLGPCQVVTGNLAESSKNTWIGVERPAFTPNHNMAGANVTVRTLTLTQ